MTASDEGDPIGATRRRSADDSQAVYTFALDMIAKLRANEHKAHWSTVENAWLHARLMGEAVELAAALNDLNAVERINGADTSLERAAVIAECADVADFAMMIADNVRARAPSTASGG